MTILTSIAVLSLAAWGWLLLGRGFFWRTDVRLPDRREPARWPPVAVVVPARNEAAVLRDSLTSLLAQDYPGHAEIILVDDGSTDGTGDVARALAARPPLSVRRGGLPLTVVSPGEPEPGWTGKMWAVRHGVATARSLMPDLEYLLLTDADITHHRDSLRDLVSAASHSGLDLLSLMARLRTVTPWERLTVPAFVLFFAQLYPFRRVNRPDSRTAAAAGGCMLLRDEAAQRAGYPESVHDAVIDDVALARAVRDGGGRIWLGLGDRVRSVRAYPRLRDIREMVARCAYTQLRHSPALLMLTVLGLLLVYAVPPVALLAGLAAGAPVTAVAGGLAWAVMAGTYLPMLRYYGLPPKVSPLLPFTAVLYLAMTVESAVRHARGRGAAWKGRVYTARPGTAEEGAGP
ncbi:glycosyltransferase [Streptomyces xinghaiensis]|uniref:glycosyltransferase n=1 Tax=Streptomyces xinghaiensis TaxID=1038928 RepID=UPI003444BA59